MRVERKRGKEVRISNEGYHALVTAESCYYLPPSPPVLIVMLSWHGYFQSDVLFDLYFNYFRASKRKKWIYTECHCWAYPKDLRLCKYSSCDLFVQVEKKSRKHPLQTWLSVLFNRQLTLWCCHLHCYFYFYWPQWLCLVLY